MLVAGVVLGLLVGPSVLGRLAPKQYEQLFVGSIDTTEVQRTQAEFAAFNSGAMDMSQNPKAYAAIADYESLEATYQVRIDAVNKQYDLFGDEDSSIKIARDEQLELIQTEQLASLQRMQGRLLDLRIETLDALKRKLDDAQDKVQAQRDAHLDKLQGMGTVMLLLIMVLLAAESILSPQRDEIEEGRATLPPALSRLVTIRYALSAGWLMLMLAQPVWLRGIDPWFGLVLLGVVVLAGLVPLGKKAAT